MYKETELCKLAFKYGSDKCPRRGKHTYTPYYYSLFKDKRKTVKKVLEIGIGKRASLFMWRDFFPNAKIYGADYRDDALVNQGRIQSILCDQRRREHLSGLIEKTGPDIDLVIDDASHRPRDQVFTCLTLMPLLKKGVIYVIEDVADPSIAERFRGYYDVEIPTLPNPKLRRLDNRLVVVRHKKRSAGISFFAKKAFRVKPDGHLSRVSSIIRGEQITEFLGAKLNPTQGYQDDVCIYVKPPYKPGDDFVFEGKPYLDIVDSMGFLGLMRQHPEVTVISLSDWSYKVLQKLLPNKIVNIPQQHCNFERAKRNREQVSRVGMIGTYHAFRYLPDGIRESLAERGMEFVGLSRFFTRQDIINFYISIDIQIVWRPYCDYSKDILVNPLKIVNAASFGIPTIAYEEKVFEEMASCYIPVYNPAELLGEVDNLRLNPALYAEYQERCLEEAEKYHIEKIAQLYRNLL